MGPPRRAGLPVRGPPHAVYLPPGMPFNVRGDVEVAIGSAPAGDGEAARMPPASGSCPRSAAWRGGADGQADPHGGDAADVAARVEVITPAGHWSSYPPHKHDRDARPMSLLEETYYFRSDPPQGSRSSASTRRTGPRRDLALGDGDTVLVPRGYHTVRLRRGTSVYYLNVMAGPTREWVVADDPDHAWTKTP